MQDKENAYFTVEAAMVLSLVLGIVTFLIHILFFQYNRCLMEQDMSALLLKGCTKDENDAEMLADILDGYAAEIYQEKYIAWKQDAVTIKCSGNKISILRRGELEFPFVDLIDDNMVGRWQTVVEYKSRRMTPVNDIRIYHKLRGGN